MFYGNNKPIKCLLYNANNPNRNQICNTNADVFATQTESEIEIKMSNFSSNIWWTSKMCVSHIGRSYSIASNIQQNCELLDAPNKIEPKNPNIFPLFMRAIAFLYLRKCTAVSSNISVMQPFSAACSTCKSWKLSLRSSRRRTASAHRTVADCWLPREAECASWKM